jgi:hypothetical protein
MGEADAPKVSQSQPAPPLQNGNRAVTISCQLAARGVRVHPRAFDHTAGTFYRKQKTDFLQKAAKETKIPWMESSRNSPSLSSFPSVNSYCESP